MNNFLGLFLAKIFTGLFLILALFVVAKDFFGGNYPDNTLSHYYSIIVNQEKVLDNEKITERQIFDLRKCEDENDYKCFLKFYENYNASTTLQQTFSNLSLLLKQFPEFVPYCHQITHGIGHSELTKNKGDMLVSLQDFSMNNYFKNLTTCGSGYFHGIIEESVKNLTNKDDLANFFSEICSKKDIRSIVTSDCIHGLGHAAFIQTNFNLPDSIYICDKVVKNKYEKFNCYTGVFMEQNLSLSKDEILTQDKSGTFSFKVCDTLVDKLQQTSCYFEHVLRFGDFTQKQNDFLEMSFMCQKIKDEVNRLGCVKSLAARSVTDAHFNNISSMCLQNTKTRAQRIFCVTTFGHRIGLSLDSKKGEVYKKVSTDICKYLSKGEEVDLCKNMILNQDPNIYFNEEKDLKI